MSFNSLEDLDKVYSADRATITICDEDLNGYRKRTMDFDNDGHEEDANSEDESVNQPSPHVAKKARKGEKRMPEVVDLTSTMQKVFNHMSSMVSHFSVIASAFSTFQQHEQAVMAREQEIDDQKERLFSEVIKIPGLTRIETIRALKKLEADENYLFIFYHCPDDEWKKDFIFSLVRLD